MKLQRTQWVNALMKRAFLLVAVLAISACGRPDVVADEENAAALPEPVNRSAPSPTGGPPSNSTAAAASGQLIPAALRGRWGLTPADCTSTRGDAKGLLVVGTNELRFYESRAVPADDVQTSENSIGGNFAFTGEGQEWTRHLTLEIRNDRLVRTERDPVSTFRYVRC